MKLNCKQISDVPIKTIEIKVPFRYVGDDDDSDVPPDFPMLDGNFWHVKIDVATGKIEDWQADKEWKLYTKVCDEGSYYFITDFKIPAGDTFSAIVGKIEKDYVPDCFPGENFGDYLILDIAPDGTITNWKDSDEEIISPELHDFTESYNY